MKILVQTCCGCCNLHTGTLIVGICGILFSGGGIIAHTSALDSIEDEDTKTQAKIFIGYSYLYIFINVLLIYGTIRESRYFLLPWLIYVAIGLGLMSIVSIIFMFFTPVLVILTLFCAALWYVWICVLSYYNQLNPTNTQPMNVYSGVNEISTVAPTVVTYVPSAPMYVDHDKGPQVV